MMRISSALVPRLAFRCCVKGVDDEVGDGLFPCDSDHVGVA